MALSLTVLTVTFPAGGVFPPLSFTLSVRLALIPVMAFPLLSFASSVRVLVAILFAVTDTGAALNVDCVPSGVRTAESTTVSPRLPMALPLNCGTTL